MTKVEVVAHDVRHALTSRFPTGERSSEALSQAARSLRRLAEADPRYREYRGVCWDSWKTMREFLDREAIS